MSNMKLFQTEKRKKCAILVLILCIFFVLCTIYFLLDDRHSGNIGPVSAITFLFIAPVFAMIYGVVSYLLTREILLPSVIYYVSQYLFALFSTLILDVPIGIIGGMAVVFSVIFAYITKGIIFLKNKRKSAQK